MGLLSYSTAKYWFLSPFLSTEDLITTTFISYIALFPIKSDKKIIMQFANVFSNCGFIGFPIIYSIFGGEGVIYASIFNMFFTIALWTYGIILFNGNIEKKDLKYSTLISMKLG